MNTWWWIPIVIVYTLAGIGTSTLTYVALESADALDEFSPRRQVVFGLCVTLCWPLWLYCVGFVCVTKTLERLAADRRERRHIEQSGR